MISIMGPTFSIWLRIAGRQYHIVIGGRGASAPADTKDSLIARRSRDEERKTYG